MDRTKLPAYGALLCFAAAWFLPVEAGAARLSDGIIPGWQAFLVSIGPVTGHPLIELDLITVRELLMAMSALSNVMMLYSFVLVLAWPRWHFWHPHRLSWHLIAAFIVNVQWMWPRGGEFLDLRVGYYLWCASFAFIAVAVWRLERRRATTPMTVESDRRRSASPERAHA